MHYLEAILKVLAVGLILGAGLPAVFAVGLVAFSKGAPPPPPHRTRRSKPWGCCSSHWSPPSS